MGCALLSWKEKNHTKAACPAQEGPGSKEVSNFQVHCAEYKGRRKLKSLPLRTSRMDQASPGGWGAGRMPRGHRLLAP